jgi:hypothetical protein
MQLLASGAVRKGLDFKKLTSKSNATVSKNLSKAISKELSTISDLSPSEIASKQKMAATKITVNTEVIHVKQD